MKEGRWAKKGLLGAELRGKTLGIVGLGRIGQAVASRARVFGMAVVAHDPYIAAHVAQDLGVELLTLDEPVRARRLHQPAPAVDVGDTPSVRRRAAVPMQDAASGS